MLGKKFNPLLKYNPDAGHGYNFLPFRFRRREPEKIILTNFVGESMSLSSFDFDRFVSKAISSTEDLYRELKSKHFLLDSVGNAAIDLLALKYRTKHHRISQFTALHLFVVSLRCDYSCPYCQVSRENINKNQFDMTTETANKALDLVFQSPSPVIKIEFQGGEPLLNFDLIKHVVKKATTCNADMHQKSLQFVIATNLSFIDDEKLDFIEEYGIYLSTSLDGPKDLHDKNRPRPELNGHELTINNIHKVRERFGPDRISALMTTTEKSLEQPEEIIDEYLKIGFDSIFLRSLSPYGFAIKTKQIDKYNATRWVEFYKRALEYIINLNKNGTFFREEYTTIILEKILSPYSPGYVDLQSPAGTGISAVVYNYDGDVYASDEARMLAEMGNKTLRIGNVHTNTYSDIFGNEVLLQTIEDTVIESMPMCTDCAYLPYCGSDPTYHLATQGNVVGHKSTSGFCEKNMAIFDHIFDLLDDNETRDIFMTWIS